MKIELIINNGNDLFLFEVKERVERAIKNEDYKNKIVEILKLDKESLRSFNPSSSRDSYVLAHNLIAKINYLLPEENE